MKLLNILLLTENASPLSNTEIYSFAATLFITVLFFLYFGLKSRFPFGRKYYTYDPKFNSCLFKFKVEQNEQNKNKENYNYYGSFKPYFIGILISVGVLAISLAYTLYCIFDKADVVTIGIWMPIATAIINIILFVIIKLKVNKVLKDVLKDNPFFLENGKPIVEE